MTTHSILISGHRLGQRTQTPASFSGYMHPAHPTPPPYHQPPQPPPSAPSTNTISNNNSSTDSRHHENDSSSDDAFATSSASSTEQSKRPSDKAEASAKQLAQENGPIVADLNKKMTDLQNEVRSLKDLNAR